MKEPKKDILGEVSIMKRFVCLIFCVLLVASFLESSYVGKVYFKQWPGEQHMKVFRVPKSFYESWAFRERMAGKNGIGHKTDLETNKTLEDQLSLLQAYFESEIQKGNLRLRLVQDDPEAMMEHHRYTQYYKDLEVFGGEIIEHFKDGKLAGINGEYYEIENLDTTPLITKEIAIHLFKTDLGKFDLIERPQETRLLVYPVQDGDFRLAYQVILEEGDVYSMTGILSASNGEVLLKWSNVQSDDITIGKGIGYHGDTLKFPTTLKDSAYWLFDERSVRPINQYTYVLSPGYFYTDNDNYWDWDGVLINVHAYEGLVYDYYYLVHTRKGIDDLNMDIKAIVHSLDPNARDNAFWKSTDRRMYFGDPYYTNLRTGAALDVIAHEYSHGVTQFTSKLAYYCTSAEQPGALNESFSDIMGTAIEFYWQQSGSGFNKADWVCGEDIYPYYGSSNYLRSLSDPNSKKSTFLGTKYPHPCHLSQCYIFWPPVYELDYGGVHFNSTLYSHSYFLLSEGGTNRVSKKSVSGIGIEKATKIFYGAWVHYMKKETASFLNAANALLQSANDLYGSSSNEYAQTIKAMEAIGWTVN